MNRLEAMTQLHRAISDMDVPAVRRTGRSRQDVDWLGRNLALRNAYHPAINDAREALRVLGARMVL